MKYYNVFALILTSTTILFAQNIDDNKVNFQFIQLPLIKIDDAFTTFETRVNHSYKNANQDSLANYELKKQFALEYFHQQLKSYYLLRDSLEKNYLSQMAVWEKNVNSGKTEATGATPIQPLPPVFPEPPLYPEIKAPHLHTDFSDATVKDKIKLAGFKEGLGGCIINVDILPLQNIQIIQNKKGSGSSTKYEYKCQYTLPIRITLESPTQGLLIQQTIGEGPKFYKMKDYSSQYDFQLYMRENEELFYNDLELSARNEAILEANNYINNLCGYVLTNRYTEIYSVKKFKNYDYSDVTKAYTQTVQACNLVKNDRNRSGAKVKIDLALNSWKSIMEESNTYDDKARINDKVSAMIYCNMAELCIWKADFDNAEIYINLAINSGVGKARRFAEDLHILYSDQRKRWEVHY